MRRWAFAPRFYVVPHLAADLERRRYLSVDVRKVFEPSDDAEPSPRGSQRVSKVWRLGLEAAPGIESESPELFVRFHGSARIRATADQ